jgi:hypothetical protein
MSNQNLYITNYCRVKNSCITTAEGIVFQCEETSLENFLQSSYDSLQIEYPKFFKMDKLSKLGLLASDVLLKKHLVKGEFSPESVAIVLSNESSSLDADLKFLESTKSMASPSLFVYTLPNIVAGEICIRHGIKGEGAFFVSENFDPEFMCNYVSMLMSQPHINTCVAGWIEVLEERYDVFLYLTQKLKRGASLVHSTEQLTTIYKQEIWSS